jgi:hypothetical protein
MTMKWEAVAIDGGTRVEITADNVQNAAAEADHAAGLASSLAKLAKYLSG